MKEKKIRFCSIICAAIVFTCLIGGITPVYAASEYSAEDNPFTDVDTNKYYYEPILQMYNHGIMQGYGDSRFGPNDELTHAQVLVMLARLCDVDTSELGSDGRWYSGALEWAETRLGLLGVPLSESITRYEVAYYITKAYQLEGLFEEAKNDGDQPFADTDSAVAEVLHDLGIAAGMYDAKGNLVFDGNSFLTRGQAATFFSRVLHLDNPVWPAITESEHRDYLADAQLNRVLDHSYYDSMKLPEKCSTRQDIVDALCFMYVNHITSLDILTDSITDEEVESWFAGAWREAISELIEYSTFFNRVSYCKHKDSLHIEFDSQADDGDCLMKIRESEGLVHRVIKDLYQSSALRDDMSVKEKAKVLCEWVTMNCAYDMSYSNYDLYSILSTHTGVCQAYTSLYTALCRHVGISIHVERGEDHVWNYIDDCGECNNRHYIDVTWCDPIPDGHENLNWFWIDPEDWTEHTALQYD